MQHRARLAIALGLSMFGCTKATTMSTPKVPSAFELEYEEHGGGPGGSSLAFHLRPSGEVDVTGHDNARCGGRSNLVSFAHKGVAVSQAEVDGLRVIAESSAFRAQTRTYKGVGPGADGYAFSAKVHASEGSQDVYAETPKPGADFPKPLGDLQTLVKEIVKAHDWGMVAPSCVDAG